MQFGLFYEWPNPQLRAWKTLFEEGVEQIQYSETLGFDDRMSIRLGEREIQLSCLGRAHSASDILLYLPGDKLLYVGEATTHQ